MAAQVQPPTRIKRENRMSSTELNQPKSAPIKATWICLVIAWVLFLVPVPGAGMFVGWPLNLVAFILAIVVMARGRTVPGLIPLISSLVVSPIVYFIGLAIFTAILGGSTNSYSEYVEKAKAAQAQSSTQGEEHAAIEEQAAAPVEMLEVTTQQLLAAYEANEVAADAQYKNKALAVSGRVAGINKDFTDSIYVELDTGEMFQNVHARGIADDVAINLQKGQQVTLECTGNGFVMVSPQLKDCRLR